MRDEKLINLGERRRITLKVWSKDSEIDLSLCTWELSLYSVEDSGTCNVSTEDDVWYLTCEVEPKRVGNYKLAYSFVTDDGEKIIRIVTLKVV